MAMPAEEKPSSASVPPSPPQASDIRQDVLGLAKQWKELAEHAVAIERHRRSGLIPKFVEEQ